MNIILMYKSKYDEKQPKELKVIGPREGVRAIKRNKGLLLYWDKPWVLLDF